MLSGFVTFEGIDGSGKTTVSRLVKERLRSQGHSVFLTSEPTRGWLGETVRRGIEKGVSPLTETFLFLADRAAHIQEIRSHLEAGRSSSATAMRIPPMPTRGRTWSESCAIPSASSRGRVRIGSFLPI